MFWENIWIPLSFSAILEYTQGLHVKHTDRYCRPKDAYGVASSEDPEQTAPEGAI